MLGLLDVYTVRARLLPALIASLPLGLAAFLWIPNFMTTMKALGIGTVVWLLAATVMAQVGRDSGKRREPSLFAQWGGSPTTRLLRHREARNKPLLERRHAQLSALTALRLPSKEEEAQDPGKADEIYETCIVFLRERTRDRKTFPLVFDENCNYGFRRNLWGLKLFAVTLAFVVLWVVAGYITILVQGNGTIPTAAIVVILGNIFFLGSWIFYVTKAWVRLAAESYADRLIGACEVLSGVAAPVAFRNPGSSHNP